MSKKFGLIAVLIMVIGAVFGGIFGRLPARTSADTALTTSKVSSDYADALNVIDNKYVGKIDHEEVTDKSIQSMLWTLDPHSSFFTSDEIRKLYEEQSSQFYGIGVSILQHRDGVYVQSVIPNTPADKSGLHYGDRFIEVDGKDAKDWTSAEVSKNVRGMRDSTVNIKVERAGNGAPLPFSIQRGGVPLPSIRNYFMLKDNVGYIGLSGGFQETTTLELTEAIENLKGAGMQSLILDLRGNPGGLLPQAIGVVSKFIPAGKTVVSVKGRTNYSKAEELRTVGGETDNFPLVVMINGGSASASEIVAGAIQDYGRGLVVGTESFGKGLVQRLFPLPYSTGLTLTTARYYTPYGRSLQRDYSSGSIYDYYTHQNEEEANAEKTPEATPTPIGKPIKTAGGRVFYGGRGIDPDIIASPENYSTSRARLSEESFFFVRQLIAGKISGLESFKTGKQNFNLTIKQTDFLVGANLLDAFRDFVVSDKESGLTAENINGQIDYAKSRIRAELATANYSSEAGQQALLETDPQIMKAIESIPEAKKLEQNIFAKK